MKNRILSIMLALAVISVPALAAEEKVNAFVGVELYQAPELLAKHLQLEEGHGQVVKNVYLDSPADKAGLEKDDILLKLNGEDIDDLGLFIDTMRNSEVGAEILLEVMHNGDLKEVEIELGPMPEQMDISNWKYPRQNQNKFQIVMPGRVFKLDPKQRHWHEMQNSFELSKMLPQTYVFRHSDEDGRKYVIKIKGDPNDSESTIAIKSDDAEYSSTIGTINALPNEIIEIAEIYIQKAKLLAEDKRYHFEYDVDVPYMSIPDVNVPSMEHIQKQMQPYMEKLGEKKDQSIDKMNKSMDKLKDQVKDLQEKLDKLLEKSDKEQNNDKKVTSPSPNDDRV